MPFTRRHLPHWIPEEAAIFVTWRLAGSLPSQAEVPAVERVGQTIAFRGLSLSCLAKHERLDHAPSGPVWMQDPRVACVIADALLYGETVRRFYQLHAWVVMPNHVHVIFQPHTAMPSIMRWLKGRSGRMANRILGRTGTPFWQDESFDHWIRSAEELRYLVEYVENNPIEAGLVGAKEQWRWSSAGLVTASPE